MKLYWHNSEFKQIRRKLARISHKRNLISKEKRRRRRRFENNLSSAELSERNKRKYTVKPIQTLTPPSHMCFISNTGEMLVFCDRLNSCLENQIPVSIQMEKVNKLSLNAITVLIAVMIRFKLNRIKFFGTMPKDPQASHLLRQSGFFNHLQNPASVNDRNYSLGSGSLFTHGKKEVDSVFSQTLIDNASEKLWGSKKRCPTVQRILVELMMNTHAHANPLKKNERWWISLQHIPEEKKVVFCFVDFGIGVFSSLSRKTTRRNTLDRMSRVLWHATERTFGITNSHVLRYMLHEQRHETVTDKYFRGKGLPALYKAVGKNAIQSLSIITNDAYYSSVNKTPYKLETPFHGTFISWELSEQNEYLPS